MKLSLKIASLDYEAVGDFFAYARRTDPETSHEAAQAIEPHLGRLESIVLTAIRQAPDGMTIDELAAATGLDKVTVSPRMKPLVRKGLIQTDGTKRKGRTRASGLVWRAK